MPAAPSPVTPTLCPLCGEPNACALERERATGTPQGACWCTQVDFAPELLARVPQQARDAACICPRCAGGIPPA